MKTINKLLVAYLAAFTFVVTTVSASDPTAALHGEWEVIELYVKGKADPGASFQGMKFAFDEENWTTFPGWTTPAGFAKKPPAKAGYTLNNNNDPKHFDFAFVTSDARIQRYAIYKIQDDKLYLCLGKTDRPGTFDTAGTENLCYVAKRANGETEKDEQ